MNTEQGYISSALLRPLLESVDTNIYEQLSQEELSLIHSISKFLKDPNGLIDGQLADQIISLLNEKSGRSGLCVQASHKFNVQSSCQLQHLFLCSNNLRESLYYLEKFSALLADQFDLQITRTRDNVIKIKLPIKENFFLAQERHRTELLMSLLLNWMRQLCGKELEISNITLPFSAPQYASHYQQQWKSSVEFNSEECTIQFHAKWLDIGLHNTNPHILNMMKREVEDQYRKLARSGSLANRISKAYSLRKIRLNANQQEVADYFHISARTLNRHLNQEGTSLKQIATKVRIEIASAQLTNSNIGIEQIAIELGLSGRRTLDRIFIKEMGMSPAQYRISQRQTAHRPALKVVNQ